MRGIRLEEMMKKEVNDGKRVRGILDYVSFVVMHVTSSYTIYVHFRFVVLCYAYEHHYDDELTLQHRVKFATFSAIIFFSLFSPYLLY